MGCGGAVLAYEAPAPPTPQGALQDLLEGLVGMDDGLREDPRLAELVAVTLAASVRLLSDLSSVEAVEWVFQHLCDTELVDVKAQLAALDTIPEALRWDCAAARAIVGAGTHDGALVVDHMRWVWLQQMATGRGFSQLLPGAAMVPPATMRQIHTGVTRADRSDRSEALRRTVAAFRAGSRAAAPSSRFVLGPDVCMPRACATSLRSR